MADAPGRAAAKLAYLQRYSSSSTSAGGRARAGKRPRPGNLRVVDETEQDTSTTAARRGGLAGLAAGDYGGADDDDESGFEQPVIVGASDALVGEYRQQHGLAQRRPPQAARGGIGRLDSSDEEGEAPPAGGPARGRARLDSSDEDEADDAARGAAAAATVEARGAGRARLDSSDEDEEDGGGPRRGAGSGAGRARLDSSDEDAPAATATAPATAPEAPGSAAAVMSSGHAAGLKTAAEFRANNEAVRRAKAAPPKGQQHELLLGNAKTVFRDKTGKVVDAYAEAQEESARKAREAALEAARLAVARVGAAQVAAGEAAAKRREELKGAPLARRVDDADLEAMHKEKLLEGDPMLALMARKARKRAAAGGANEPRSASGKPLYKGPPAPPNRFGMQPGHRWDGQVRGNGFEERALRAGAERQLSQARVKAASMGGVFG